MARYNAWTGEWEGEPSLLISGVQKPAVESEMTKLELRPEELKEMLSKGKEFWDKMSEVISKIKAKAALKEAGVETVKTTAIPSYSKEELALKKAFEEAGVEVV